MSEPVGLAEIRDRARHDEVRAGQRPGATVLRQSEEDRIFLVDLVDHLLKHHEQYHPGPCFYPGQDYQLARILKGAE